MGVISTNRLNRFWKRGVKPIKEAVTTLQSTVEELSKKVGTTPTAVGTLSSLKTTVKTNLVAAINEVVDKKLDKTKVVASTNVTEPGFAMDAKTASEEFAKLNSNSGNDLSTVVLLGQGGAANKEETVTLSDDINNYPLLCITCNHFMTVVPTVVFKSDRIARLTWSSYMASVTYVTDTTVKMLQNSSNSGIAVMLYGIK